MQISYYKYLLTSGKATLSVVNGQNVISVSYSETLMNEEAEKLKDCLIRQKETLISFENVEVKAQREAEADKLQELTDKIKIAQVDEVIK